MPRFRIALVPLLIAFALSLAAPRSAIAASPTGVIGVDASQLDARHWIARLQRPDAVALDRATIAARNRELLALDPSLHDIEDFPASLDAATVRKWIAARSARPARALYDARGKPVAKAAVDAWMAALALDAIPRTQPTRYGLIVRRAALRTFPTVQRVFSAPGDTDIDRFQESAFFPGTVVVIAHASRDGKWWFVVGRTYAAWVEKSAVAEGSKTDVFEYARQTPFLVVTGATVRTTFNPERPEVSDLQLDMGTRVPLVRDWPGTRPVNGQAAYASYVIALPVRGADGKLEIVPALLPRSADVSPDYLPLTRANLLRQAFKFLGERYGWGHDYDARDCSGFVSEVYRSFGLLMPRNTGDQAKSAAFDRIMFKPRDGRGKRMDAVGMLAVGNLVYIPGHVMLVIGSENGAPYVIHDIQKTAWLGDDVNLVQAPLNGVSVTPLVPLRANVKQTYVDRITDIQRMLPRVP